jgi:circadian clock protein KaiB
MIYELRLFVTGRTPQSQRAVENLWQICEETIPGRYQIEVIDVLERPQMAEEDKILATPTLVRRTPRPQRKIIGDLSDRERVIHALDLTTEASAQINTHAVRETDERK